MPPLQSPVGLLLVLLLGCNPNGQPDPRETVWVAYERRGTLHRVRGDGSAHTRLRKRVRRAPPRDEPDVQLYDLWRDPAVRPGAETIAAIRGRNLSFSVHPADPAEFDQSWELVLVDPRGEEQDRVLHRSTRELEEPRWNTAGTRIVTRLGRRDLLVWGGERCSEHTLRFPTGEAQRPDLMVAGFAGDDRSLDLLFDAHLEIPYLLAQARLRPGALDVMPDCAFESRNPPHEVRARPGFRRLFGPAHPASVMRPPFFVTPRGDYAFYYRKREGLFPRGWIEGLETRTGEVFEVRTLWRGLYVE